MVLAFVLSLWTPACGGDDSSEPDTFRIGVMESLTGLGETYGTVANQAKQLAADEINAAGGINGRRLELIVEDSKCSAADAVVAYRQADRREWREDHTGHFLQQRHAGSSPTGIG